MTGIGVFAAVVLLFALVSGRLRGSPVSPPLVFAAAGALAALVGGANLTLESLGGTAEEAILTVAELALALVLFADAASIGLRQVAGRSGLPGRLLTIGLPLTIAAGALAATGLLGDLDTWECVLVAALLAPTDAALARPVMQDPRVPKRVREALDVEAGLNDGICVPVVTFAVAGVVSVAGTPETSLAHEALKTLVGGTLVGLGAGWLGGRLVRAARARGAMDEDAEPLVVAALAVATFYAADSWGASGFIAAYIAGLVAASSLGERRHSLLRFTEQDGALLAYAVFFIFGILAESALAHVTWSEALYALLSLTVIRMVPVALALTGSGLRPPTVAFMGWFGPRGIASIALMFVVLAKDVEIPGIKTVGITVVMTVALSIVLHGLSAPWLTARYGRWVTRANRASG